LNEVETRRWVWYVILVGTVARLTMAASIGLGVDESYAVAVARPVSLSYYDHPPLVFWITALTQRIFGSGSDVVLRLPFIVIFAATTWMVSVLAARLFGEREAVVSAILLQVIPVFGVSDGGWILPDGPLLFGFAATALCVWKALAASPGTGALRWWVAAGLSAGVALVSNYHALFLIAGLLVFLLTTTRGRRWLARPEPYVAAAVALLISSPVFIWNAHHGWASFRFQGGRATVQHGLHVSALFQNLAGQAGYILPWIWVPLVGLFVSAVRRGPRDEARWLLACLAAGPILTFTALSLGGRPGLPHWPAPGFLFLVPLLAESLVKLERDGHRRFVKRYLAGTGVVVAALVTFAASQVRTGWFSRAVPTLFTRGDPSLDAVDWRELQSAVDTLAPTGRPIVVAANWIDAAKLGAALGPRALVLCFNDDARHFRYVADADSLSGRDAFLVVRADPRSHPAGEMKRLALRFRSVSVPPAAVVPIHRGGYEVLRLVVYRGHGILPAR
jgi:4-amino-4-deoxy-L-arabinose transferase-like glycosyltransferase